MPALLSLRRATRPPEPEPGPFTFALPEPYPRESDFARACRPACADRIEDAIARVLVRHGLGGGMIL
jgi:hypothetical protein